MSLVFNGMDDCCQQYRKFLLSGRKVAIASALASLLRVDTPGALTPEI
jgi:hypothetical protein